MRKAARWIALVLVGITAVVGVINASDELGEGDTLLQQSVGVAVAMYAAASWLVLFAVWRRRPWGVAAAIVWTLATIWAASVGTYAFGGAPAFAVVMAGASCLLVGSWVVWAVRDAIRARAVAAPESAP